MMKTGVVRIAIAAAVALATLPAQAATVFFDDFNDGNVSDWAFTTNYGGSAGVDLGGIYGPHINAPPGGSNLIARGTKTLMLAGGDYQLTMDARSVACSGCVISFDVLFDGVLLTRQATGGAWVFREFNLNGLAAGAHLLTLGMHTTNASSGHFLATFDNVRLTGDVVPEPASWAMMIGGFGLVGAAMRRRRLHPA